MPDEVVPCSVRPAIAYLGFFEMRTPKVISSRPVGFVWSLRVAVEKNEANVPGELFLIVSRHDFETTSLQSLGEKALHLQPLNRRINQFHFASGAFGFGLFIGSVHPGPAYFDGPGFQVNIFPCQGDEL